MQNKYCTGLGRRIHIIGSSCSGKSTLGERLAKALDTSFVELDVLNWEPNWENLSQTNPQEYENRLIHSTSGDNWVVAGSYINFCQKVFWPRLECVIWLDLPLGVLLKRIFIRSWKRWWNNELLWGTNYESFWSQLLIWRTDTSLIGYTLTHHKSRRESILSCMTDPRWALTRFIRFTSAKEVEDFIIEVEKARIENDNLVSASQ